MRALPFGVTQGYSTSNSVTVSGGLDASFVKESLGGTFGIDYSHSWTTSAEINIQGVVDPGHIGVRDH